jgi:hypothetical protein
MNQGDERGSDRPRSKPADQQADGGESERSGPFSYVPMDHAARIETTIQQAIREGAFDDLPGAGKPLRGLGARTDPDWWLRQKIEDEELGGLGPAALTLRSEDATLRERLDELYREVDVREAVEEFNRRVIEARRQLQGGPPVITPTRDVDAEVGEWHRRRTTRNPSNDPAPEPPRPSWRERRRAERQARRSTGRRSSGLPN